MKSPNRKLLEALMAEQQESWRRGDRILVETYLERYPVLQSDPEGILDLIASEIDARARRGESPPLDEYLGRFPQSDGQIRNLIRDRWALQPNQPTDAALLESVEGEGPDEDRGSVAGVSDLPVIPGYEIEYELGHGGMGVVYKARQLRPDRVVALKMIGGRSRARPNELTRFRQEAEAAARLQHPHIVQVYEVNDHDGRPYFSMEFVDGSNLANRVNGTPQPARQAAALVETLARAMHFAHQRGIIHRDLKPANVLLPGGPGAPIGQCLPKITDFGLAKRLDQEAGPTQSGDLVGTPSYMAPEQASGKVKEISPATDVYALGAILYELLTGRPPFKGETALDTLDQVRSEEPIPPRRLQPKLPRDLETICLKCLQKAPAQRYASAQALAEDLRRFLAGESIEARPVGGWERGLKWVRRRPAVAGLLGALLVVVVGGLAGMAALWQRAEEQRREAETARRVALEQKAKAEDSRTQVEGQLVRFHVASGAEFLDDGDLLGAVTRFPEALRLEHGGPASEQVHRARIAAFLRHSPRLLQVWPHPASVHGADFSPDGRWVATTCADGTVRVWEVATGTLLTSLEYGGSVHQVVFSPDSRGDRLVLAASQGRVIRVWDRATGKTVVFPPEPTADPKDIGTGARGYVAFRPDGRQVVGSGGGRAAEVWSAETGKLVWSSPQKEPVNRAVYSPDGKWVATAGQDGRAVLWDAITGTRAKHFQHDEAVLDVTFSPDSRRLVTASADRTACVWDVNTGARVACIGHRLEVLQAAFSRDGSRVLTNGKDRKVSVWDARTGQHLGKFLEHGHLVSGAAFSPDGRYLVTGSEDHTAAVMDLMTGQLLIPPLKHSGAVRAVAFSPDGRCVLTAGDDQTVRLWDAHPGYLADPALRHPGMVHYAAFSPDGRLVVTACEDGLARIWDAASGREVRQPLRHDGPVLQAVFSPDGQKIVTASKDKTARVWLVSGAPVTRPLRHPDAVLAAHFSRDGSSVVTACADQTAWVWDVTQGQLRYSLLKAPKETVPPPRRMPGEGGDVRFPLRRTSDQSLLVGLVSTLISGPDEPPPTPAPIPSAPPLNKVDPPGKVPGTPPGMSPTPNMGSPPGMGPGMAPGMSPTTPPGMSPTPSGAGLLSESFSPPSSAGQAPREAAPASPGPISVSGGRIGPWGGIDTADLSRLTELPTMMRASFSPEGRWVVTTFGKAAQLWDAATGKPAGAGVGAYINYASVGPKEARLVVAGGHQALVWDFDTGKPMLLQHPQWVYHAAFSPDGSRLVTACLDGGVRVWDVTTGQMVTRRMRHGSPVHEVGFSSAGDRLFSVSYDGTARVWDAATGEPLTPPIRHRRGVVHAEFSPDRNKLLTACLDGTVRIWDLSPAGLWSNPEDLAEYAKLLAGRRTDLAGGEVFLDAAALSRSLQALKGKYPSQFAISAEQHVAWHRQEAEACAQEAARACLSRRRDPSPRLLPPVPADNSEEESAWWFAAARHLDHLIQADPAQGSYYRRRARAYLGMREWDRAIADCAIVLKLEQTGPEIRHYQGWAHAHLGKWPQAREDFAAAARQKPNDVIAWLGLSLAHAHLRQWDQAEAAYVRASRHTRAFLIKGDVRWGDWETQNALSADSGTLALALIQSRLPVAPSPIRKVKGKGIPPSAKLDGGDRTEWWWYRAGGLTSFVLGDRSRAEQHFKTACELHPRSWHNWYGLFRTVEPAPRVRPEPAPPPKPY